MRNGLAPYHLLHPAALQVLDQPLRDCLAVFHAGFVSWTLGESLEGLALLQGEGQAIGEIVGRGFHKIHVQSHHGSRVNAIR